MMRSPSRARITAIAALLSLALAQGCVNYRVPATAPTAGTTVRIVSSAPMSVYEGRVVPATPSECSAREISGKILDIRGDTVTLGSGPIISHAEHPRACRGIQIASLLAPRTEVQITIPRANVGGTLSIIFLIAMTGVAALGIALSSGAK